MILTNTAERNRFLKFATVGVFGAIVDFGIFNLVTQLTLIPAVYATMISFTAAVISNFVWNRYWTYPDSRSKPIYGQVVQFILVSLIGLGIRTPLFAFLEHNLINMASQILPRNFLLKPTFVGHNVSLAIAVLVVMLWNFFANRFWTYNDVK